jgi:hypothetical protein
VIAWTVMGTSWIDSERRCEVTTTSVMLSDSADAAESASAAVAPYALCAAAALSAAEMAYASFLFCFKQLSTSVLEKSAALTGACGAWISH